MTRNGKIARLPRDIREELNTRLANGETGVHLVQWLNSLPEVKNVLASDFGGRPINEPNLTEWKQGGYQDWLRHEEARDWVAQLVEESEDLDYDTGSVALADRAANAVMVGLIRLLRESMAAEDPVKQSKTLVTVSQQLTYVRRATRQAEQIRLEERRWAVKEEQARWLAKFRAKMHPDLVEAAPATP